MLTFFDKGKQKIGPVMCSGFYSMAKRNERLGVAKMTYKVFIFSSLTDAQTTSILWKLF